MLSFIFDAVFPPRPTQLLVRTATRDALAALIRPTSVILPSSTVEAIGLLSYHEALVQAHIVEAKYHESQKAQTSLGALLAEYLLETLADANAFDAGPAALVPIPLSRTRRAARGYNQTERICTAACAALGGGAEIRSGILVRTRDTVPQTKLSRAERLMNMQGAFAASHAPIDPAVLYIVVDDVATTGATLASAANALRAAGATRILAIALAH